MSGGAIMMMVMALALVWGGLAAAIVHLVRTPDVARDDDE